MSGENKIEIKMSATGGEAAAAEVKKVDAAITQETKTVDLLGQELIEADKAFKKASGGAEEFAVSSKKLETVNSKLEDATKKVTSSGVSMGNSMKNVGYQVQDLAVQIGSGTSAFTALGQQMPQLLSGFGPMGVLFGTISAVALPLAGALFKLGDAAEKSDPKVEALNDKLEKLREKSANVAAEKSATKLQLWIDALDDEELAILNQNTALQRNIELMRLKRKDEAETADIERELEIAKIETDPNKTEAQKITEVAAVRERGARAAVDEKKRDLADQADSTALKSIADWEASIREEDDLAKAQAKKKELEKEKALLKGRVISADAGKAGVIAIDAELKEMEDKRSKGNLWTGPTPFSKAEQDRREELKRRRIEQEALSNSVDQKDRDKLNNPKEGGKDIDTEISTIEKVILERTAKLEKARMVSAESRIKAEEARMIAAERTPQIEKRLEVSNLIQNTRTSAAVLAAEKRAEEEARRKKDKDEADSERRRKEGLQDRIDKGEDGLDANARRDGLRIRNKGVSSGNETLKRIGQSLSDGTDAAEIQKLGDLVNEKQAELGREMVIALKKILESLATQANQISVIKGQIKNVGRLAR